MERSSSRTVCEFHRRGSCRFGISCRNLHLENESEVALREEEERLSGDATCGICFEPIQDSFGLLNCNCAFCLVCIRKWRSEGRDVVTSADVRRCPLCRVESFEVTPSPRLIVDPERKAALVRSYEGVKAKTVCRNYNPSVRNSCRFGDHCKFLHSSSPQSSSSTNSSSSSTSSSSSRNRFLNNIFPEDSSRVSDAAIRASFYAVMQVIFDDLDDLMDHDQRSLLAFALVMDSHLAHYGARRMSRLRLVPPSRLEESSSDSDSD